MKKYSTSALRNVVLISHGGHGTTSLGEAILFNAGAVNRLGSVDEGNSVLDFEEEEQSRRSSISASVAACEYKGRKINLIDLPGLADFVGDVDGALRAADAAVLVVSAVDGVEVRTERLWEAAGERGLPRAIFINKMDRERAGFERTLQDLRDTLDLNPVALTTPIGEEASFRGVIDLIDNKAILYPMNGSAKAEPSAIPGDLAAEVRAQREAFVEEIAGTDEQLMERYFEDGDLSSDAIRAALGPALTKGLIVPVFVGSATKNAGVELLMDFIVGAFPSPAERPPARGVKPNTDTPMSLANEASAPFSAYVFKTLTDKYTGQLSIMRVMSGSVNADTAVHNVNKDAAERFGALLCLRGKDQTPVEGAACGDIVAVAKLKDTATGHTLTLPDVQIRYPGVDTPSPAISFAIEATRQGDEDKIYQGLAKLAETDPSLRLTRDVNNGTLLSGMGQLHIESTLLKLKRKFNIEAQTTSPKVPYRETIKGRVPDVRYRHKKQTGGKGQFAEVIIDLLPNDRGDGFQFIDDIVGGTIPRGFIPAVEKGIVETMAKGIIAGYPIVDFKIRLHDGKYHDGDSSEMAFKIASAMAFKNAMRDPRAKAILLEPIMEMEITVPEDNLGDIMGDLSSRRGRPMGMEARGKYQVIKAQAPMAEVLRYSPDLRSITGGRGEFIMRQSHYEEVPREVAGKIIEGFKDDDDE